MSAGNLRKCIGHGEGRWLVGVVALLVLVSCEQRAAPDRLLEGGAFPSLALPRFDGGQTDLREWRGKLVILNLWATWCAPCRAELPSLDRLAARLDPERFAVLGLSVDSEIDIAREFLAERAVRHARFEYIDQDQRISREILQVRAYPITFIIDPHGKLLRRILGEREWDHPEVVAALEAAWAGDLQALSRL